MLVVVLLSYAVSPGSARAMINLLASLMHRHLTNPQHLERFAVRYGQLGMTRQKEATMQIGDLAAAVGKGLLAGAVGTAAMTVSSTLEAKLRDRESSTAPADAAAKVLGVAPASEAGEARFSNLVHWAYGTGWGAVRGLLDGLRLNGSAATASHFGAVWGSGLVMLPALEVAPPLREWGAEELAIDAFHHLVYATVTGLAYSALDRRSGLAAYEERGERSETGASI